MQSIAKCGKHKLCVASAYNECRQQGLALINTLRQTYWLLGCGFVRKKTRWVKLRCWMSDKARADYVIEADRRS